MITLGNILRFKRLLVSGVITMVSLCLIPFQLHAQSEGLVKSQPATNNFTPKGLSSDQLAAADGLVDAGDTEKAIKTYRYIAKNYPKSKEAPTAQFKLAKQLKSKGEFESAFNEYQNLLKKYPETSNFEESVADQINIANSYLKGMKVKFL